MRSLLDLLDEVSDGLVGAGLVLFVLFPFAIPIIALTFVALLPVLVVGVVFGLLAAVIAAPFLLLRRLWRALRRAPDERGDAAAVIAARAERNELLLGVVGDQQHDVAQSKFTQLGVP
jgi:hypothetical protein